MGQHTSPDERSASEPADGQADTLKPLRKVWLVEGLKLYGPAAVLVIAAFWLAFLFVEPAPPGRLVVLSGPETGGYHQAARQLKPWLEERGLEVEIVATAGSVDNLERLITSEADAVIGFVQSGAELALGGVQSDVDLADLELEALASVYFEPIWLFTRRGESPRDLTELLGRRIAVGPARSGTRAVAARMLALNGVPEPNGAWATISGPDIGPALKDRRLDAAFLVGGVASPTVAALLEDPRLAAMGYRRADAYARRMPYLSRLVLPEGSVNLAANLPPRDVRLVAATATLVARTDLHPALIDLVLQGTRELMAGPSLFARPRQFPSPDHVSLPLNADALRFHDRGPSLFQRFLPYWAATLIDRWLVMLVPLLTLLLPLMRIMPPAYRWRIRSRIYRWYKDLRRLEAAAVPPDPMDRAALMAELDHIEEETSHIEVPLSYADALYDLRLHIRFLKDKVAASGATAEAGE